MTQTQFLNDRAKGFHVEGQEQVKEMMDLENNEVVFNFLYSFPKINT